MKRESLAQDVSELSSSIDVFAQQRAKQRQMQQQQRRGRMLIVAQEHEALLKMSNEEQQQRAHIQYFSALHEKASEERKQRNTLKERWDKSVFELHVIQMVDGEREVRSQLLAQEHGYRSALVALHRVEVAPLVMREKMNTLIRHERQRREYIMRREFEAAQALPGVYAPLYRSATGGGTVTGQTLRLMGDEPPVAGVSIGSQDHQPASQKGNLPPLSTDTSPAEVPSISLGASKEDAPCRPDGFQGALDLFTPSSAVFPAVEQKPTDAAPEDELAEFLRELKVMEERSASRRERIQRLRDTRSTALQRQSDCERQFFVVQRRLLTLQHRLMEAQDDVRHGGVVLRSLKQKTTMLGRRLVAYQKMVIDS